MGKIMKKTMRTEDVTTRVAKEGAKGRARKGICQRRKPVRYGPSTWIEEKNTRNFPILKADTPSDN